MVILLIMGPTASGKSALALRLAQALGGEIVNTDSMQVYRDLRALTARPSIEEESQAPHHLYGWVDAAERYSVGRWLADARACIAGITARGRTPILAGGTGLYFKALTEGLTDAPPADPDIRAALRARLEALGAPGLHAELAARDPEAAARIGPNDPSRVLRALETVEMTGRTLSEWRAATPVPMPRAAWRGLCLTPERDDLYRTIDARFASMIERGALEEAAALAARGLDADLPCMKAHGAPPLMAHLRGEITLEAAVSKAQQDTRNYAKRQFTWMRGQMAGWPRAAPDAAFDAAMALSAQDYSA